MNLATKRNAVPIPPWNLSPRHIRLPLNDTHTLLSAQYKVSSLV